MRLNELCVSFVVAVVVVYVFRFAFFIVLAFFSFLFPPFAYSVVRFVY